MKTYLYPHATKTNYRNFNLEKIENNEMRCLELYKILALVIFWEIVFILYSGFILHICQCVNDTHLSKHTLNEGGSRYRLRTS